MCPEFDQHIREKYPLIFSGRCEMSVGDGWFDIIDSLCANIQSRIDNVARQREYAIEWNDRVNDSDHEWTAFGDRKVRAVPDLVEQVEATQIKEKFGTLRFYYSGGDDYIRGLEAMADSMSARLCEDCGKPGKTGGKNWIKTQCREHRKEED